MDCILTTAELTKRFGVITALDRVSLQLPRGKIIGLLGPNGSGKTTLLKLLAGLLSPTAGEIQICGLPVGPETKAIVSYLPDRNCLDPKMRVREHLDYFQEFFPDFDRSRAEKLLRDLAIPVDYRFSVLSKGTREKVQLALTMSRRARVYLLDEPIGGVDPAARDYILNTIVTNYDPQATVIISTHLIADVEPILDGFIFLRQGRVIRSGSADEARAESGLSLDELFREVFRCLPNC